eukprot:943178-Prorocentrum_minimum.AAC.1
MSRHLTALCMRCARPRGGGVRDWGRFVSQEEAFTMASQATRQKWIEHEFLATMRAKGKFERPMNEARQRKSKGPLAYRGALQHPSLRHVRIGRLGLSYLGIKGEPYAQPRASESPESSWS